MTNREKLLQELCAMNDEQLDRTLCDDNLYNRLTDRLCADCKRRAGGDCPNRGPDGEIPDEAPCPELTDWMDWPNDGRQVIVA